MNMIMIKEKRLTKALFLSIIIMFLPIAISANILHHFSYLAPLYSVSFVIQLLLLLYAIKGINSRISVSSILIIIVNIIISMIPILRNNLISINTHNFDYLNIIIKTMNIFVFYGLFKKVSISRESIAFFMELIVKFSVLACAFSLITEFDEIISIRSVINTNLININSFFSNRNQFASFLLTGMLANLFILINKKNRRSNYIIFFMQFVFIFITFSRGALFSVIVIISMLILQFKSRKKSIIVLFSIILLLSLLLGTGISDYLLTNVLRTSNFDSGRQTIWKYGMDIIGGNYITGVGKYTSIDLAQSNGMEKSEFHNMYMEFLVSGGILEFSFILIIVVSIYKNLIKKCPDSNYIKIFRIAFLVFAMRGSIESLSIFSLGYSDTLYTIFYVTLPLLVSNMKICSD